MVENMDLTPNQRAALDRAPGKRAKARLRAGYARQNKGSAQPQRQSQPDQRTRRVAGNNPRARGATHQPLVRVPRPVSLDYAFNGFDKRHLPVDECTAPYTVTNFITPMEFHSAANMDKVIVVAPRMHGGTYTVGGDQQSLGPFTDFIAMEYDASETVTGTIPTLQIIRCPIIEKPALTTEYQYFSVRARLHNLSVRLECLGTNTGLYPPGAVYIGTVPSIEGGHGTVHGTTGETLKIAWAEDSIQTGYLRSLSAASLIEKPFDINSAIAENVSYKTWRDFYLPKSADALGSLAFATSLEPIVLYIPRCGSGETVVNYRINIGQQWCSRHPFNVMLRSTQKQYKATSPDLWHKAVSVVKDTGLKVAEHAASGAVEALSASVQRALAPPGTTLASIL